MALLPSRQEAFHTNRALIRPKAIAGYAFRKLRSRLAKYFLRLELKPMLMWTEQNQFPKEEVPFMNTLTYCVNKAVKGGYTDNFKVTDRGLQKEESDTIYHPEQVKVVNYFRFEGQSDPGDNTILYIIETDDGSKGTLIDAYGAYSDPKVNKFMKQVEDLHKKTLLP